MNIIHQISAVLLVATLSSSNILKSGSTGSTFELLILHNNDMHARFEQTSQLSGTCTVADREAGKCYGGFPRVAHVVKEARKAAASGEGPPVLYLNAGDTYTGTVWFTTYKWKIAAEFLNALQPDAVSLGNHEFDEGVSGLTPFIENLTCPVLACNLNLNREPNLKSEKNLMNSIIFNISGTNIAVIGYLTPETKYLAIKNNVEYIDEVTAIKQEVAELKQKGIHILIALGHSGFTKDLEIAREVDGIDLVIGGHTNTFLWNGTAPDAEIPEGPYPAIVKQASGRIVPAVQAYAYTKYLGKLHLSFDDNGELISYDGNPILLDNSVLQDTEVLSIVNKYSLEISKVSEILIGYTSVILDGISCRIQECNLGNLITDALIYKYASEYNGTGWTDTPISIVQGGGIRNSIKHEEINSKVTKGDLLIVLPFSGKAAVVTVNGTIINSMLEHSVAQYNSIRPLGQFLQVSGMKVEFDFMKKSGNRVKRVLIRCGECEIPEYFPLSTTKSYKIIMPSFLSMGGDGFSIFSNLPSTLLNYNELDATEEYITTHSPISPIVEGRVVIHNADKLIENIASSLVISHISLFLLIIFFIL